MKDLVAMLQGWGPTGVALIAALDSAGIPLPAAVDAMIALITITSPGKAVLTAVLAVVGSLAGSMVLYWIARKGGEAYLERHAQTPRARRFRAWFGRYGMLTVFIPALVPIPLPLKVFVLSAGALGVSPVSFAGVMLVARVLRYSFLAWLGSHLGADSLPWLKAHVLHLGLGALVLFVVLYLAVQAGGEGAEVA